MYDQSKCGGKCILNGKNNSSDFSGLDTVTSLKSNKVKKLCIRMKKYTKLFALKLLFLKSLYFNI